MTVKVRPHSRDDEPLLLNILNDAFGIFADTQRTRSAFSSNRFDKNGCFVAEENHIPIGWIAATRLPQDNWYVIRYLSARKSLDQTGVAENLLETAIRYVESKNPEYVRATTPSVRQYVEIYRKHGFRPLRRDFRISWKTDDINCVGNTGVTIEELDERNLESASGLYVRALSPFWDWRTREEGGKSNVQKSFIEDKDRGAHWYLAKIKNEPVGLAGMIPNYYGPGSAWFRGAFVPPDKRGNGIGTALMSIIAQIARSLKQTKMTVYTFSYLDSLAPGALLYLKTGGKIEAEYLQLTRPEPDHSGK